MITCHPDVKEEPVKADDKFILIGCDGIWEKYVENSQGIIDKVLKEL